MKRTPLKRKTPLRRAAQKADKLKLGRNSPMRGRKESVRRSDRKREPEYRRWIKLQPCCASGLSQCYGEVEADHAGRRPYGRKADDNTCIPLCQRHHEQRASFHGPFKTWNQAMMRLWLHGHILVYQAQYKRR